MRNILYRQQGEVSLFVVIFATLLLTIVTVSFVRIMMNDQQQASTIDLSQSAYDSAQAGVEDAKRAILHYQTVCSAAPESSECDDARASLDPVECNRFAQAGGLDDVASSNSGKEVKIQNSATGNDLDQAYTCVTVTLNTEKYIGTLKKGSYEIIPLVAEGGQFDAVDVSWFTSSNYDHSLGSPTLINKTSLVSSWPQARPSILRSQLAQFSSNNGFVLDDFDRVSGAYSNANTLFLYPSSSGTVYSTGGFASFAANDARRSDNPGGSASRAPGSPYSINCDDTNFPTAGGYSCTARIKLPEPINSGGTVDRVAYLRLGAIYNPADYTVSLSYIGNPVKFNGVQPEIDSTGRANNLFRRVKTSVKLSSDFAYPAAEIYTSNNLCKNFLVTNSTDHYSFACTP